MLNFIIEKNIFDKFFGYMFVALGISIANYTGRLLNCNVQNILKKNIITVHIIFIMLIYLNIETILFNNYNPILNKLILTILLYLGVLLLTKLNFTYLSILFIIFLIYKTINTELAYIKNNNNNNSNNNNSNNSNNSITNSNNSIIDIISNILIVIMILVIIIGNIQYYIKQKNNHKNFNIITYIFSLKQCKNN